MNKEGFFYVKTLDNSGVGSVVAFFYILLTVHFGTVFVNN